MSPYDAQPRERWTMTWETPTFVEINMSAEIGGYQSDFEDQDPVHPADPHLGGKDDEADPARP